MRCSVAHQKNQSGEHGFRNSAAADLEQFDVTLSKKILLGKDERRLLRIRIEAYNIFNHTEFSTIGTRMEMQGTSQTNTTWGQYTATLAAGQMSTTLRLKL